MTYFDQSFLAPAPSKYVMPYIKGTSASYPSSEGPSKVEELLKKLERIDREKRAREAKAEDNMTQIDRLKESLKSL
jgi:hypothetical protein